MLVVHRSPVFGLVGVHYPLDSGPRACPAIPIAGAYIVRFALYILGRGARAILYGVALRHALRRPWCFYDRALQRSQPIEIIELFYFGAVGRVDGGPFGRGWLVSLLGLYHYIYTHTEFNLPRKARPTRSTV